MDEVGFQAAKDFLQGGLEKLIQDTSDAYLKEVDDFVDPVVEDRFEKEKVQEWREASVKLVEDVFWRLQAFASESQDLPASIKTAQEHTQEIINQVFGWTSEDHSNSRVFLAWLGGDKEGCPWAKAALTYNAKFWDCFKDLLRALGNDARSRPRRPVPVSRSANAAKPPQHRKNKGRPRDKLVEYHRNQILSVIEKGLTGEEYCARLTERGIATPIRWQKNEGCPKTYLDAYNHQDLEQRKKWRARIYDEKNKISRAKRPAKTRT